MPDTPKLSATTTAVLPASVAQPAYDRESQKCGIVHFGIGAFHRAHEAVYTDDAMNAGDSDWGIIGVSLRSAGVAAQMNPQAGLYTVAARSREGARYRLIGAVQKVLVAPREREAVIAAIASPDTHIVSFTITEKGYCRAAGGTLDLALAGERSVYAYLATGMQRRKAQGLSGLTFLSCDNLADNGGQLARLMSEYLGYYAPEMLVWFASDCTCPSTMVDRIVPATTPDDHVVIAAALGVMDDASVITEPFSQWVIEDNFAGPRPKWEVGGAQFTSNVQAYETAKLRMLNGAHSALAYLGLAEGYEFVHQAIADSRLRTLIETLMRDEAAPSITPAPGQDLNTYATALLERFANPALNHRLVQIAMDGSQKIPQRWLETLVHHQRNGQQCPAILTALAAWIKYVRGEGHLVDDPKASELAAVWRDAGREGVVAALFGEQGLFSASYVVDPLACTALQSLAE